VIAALFVTVILPAFAVAILTLNDRARATFYTEPGYEPTRYHEVLIYAQDGTTKLFGGVIRRRTQRTRADVATALGCVSGAWLLRQRSGPRWTVQFAVNLVAGLIALGAGLAWFGRDGKMATYAGMVLACALTLWWRGFGPGRR
jgi:hypothetical protein